MNQRTLMSGLGLVVALVLLFFVNLVSDRVFASARLDLTEHKLYTLSEGAGKILDELTTDITLEFYYSKELATEAPGLPEFAKRIREMLEEFEAEANGKLTVREVNPKAFSVEEDRAASYGLVSYPVGPARDQLFLGLVGTNEVDDVVTIPFFQFNREDYLEYDIAKLVSDLENVNDPKVIGIVSSLPIQGTPDFSNPQAPRPAQPWFVVEQLQSSFETRFLAPADLTDVDDDIAVLLVVHPKDLPDAALYAIDQYVLGGGRAMMFVDPHCQFDPAAANSQMGQPANVASDGGPLLAAWGLELVEGKLVGDKNSATLMQRNQPEFLPFLTLREDRMSSDDITTADLKLVTLFCAGRLKAIEGATTTAQPLFTSTSESQEIDAFMLQFGGDPAMLLDNFVSADVEMNLGMRVNGQASSAFPDGRPSPPEDPADDSAEEAEEEPDAPDPEHMASGDINVMVVADVDMLADQLWVQIQNFMGVRIPQVLADNGQFVLNSVENMTGSTELISLRTRSGYNRPFLKKQELEEAANTAFRAKEQELESELAETERRINELMTDDQVQGGVAILSTEQQEELERFRERKLEIRSELREVKLQLNEDIDALGGFLKFVNVLLVPLIVIVLALILLLTQSARRTA